jgi:hypothetical protein
MSDPIFLHTPKAAERIGLAATTLEKMRCRGDGPPYLLVAPRRVVYDVAALDNWARARVFNSTAEYQAV